MKFNPRSRRAFLQGVGGASLAVPFLSSLAPSRAAAAERAPMRFAMMYYPYGNTPRYWWDNNTTAAPSSDGAYQSRALSDIPGSLSTVLGPSFDGSIRKKMAVVRGLDPLGHPHAHNATFATCADSGEDIPGGMFGWQGCTFRYSIDSVLEDSARFYPSRPAMTALRTRGKPTYQYGQTSSWSWKERNGVIQNIPCEWDCKVVYDKVFNAGGQMDPAVAARLARYRDITSAVNDDFKQTIAGRRISAHDKVRLQNFMDMVSQIRGRLDAPVVACSRTSDLTTRLGQLDDYDKINALMIDMEVAALACGTTKIVMHGLGSYGPGLADVDGEKWHAMAHGGAQKTGTLVDTALKKSQWHAGLFAQLIKKLDSVTEGDGNTLLDNTLVLYRSEDTTGAHFLMDTPVLVAGGKGKIKTDLYIDYRNFNDPLVGGAIRATTNPDKGTAFFGRPYNNLLVTTLQALGLTQADYAKYPGQQGFGRYDGGGYALSGKNYDKYLTGSERNAPLPGLFTG